jgi:hypothetical protein
MTNRPALFALAASLAACSGPAPEAPANEADTITSAGATEPAIGNATTPAPTDAAEPASVADAITPAPAPRAKVAGDYLGRWRGVEGMFLTVTQAGGGGVSLEMQWDLDNKGTFPATVTPEGLRFTRGGETLVARPSDGDATGLKWLAGKKDCLTVKPGEGYCRI